jgi:hypothetical protein
MLYSSARGKLLIGLGLVLSLSVVAVYFAPQPPVVRQHIPDSLSDAEYWNLITEFSEPGGYFRSENFVSNESAFQRVIPTLKKHIKPGGVYLGVGPDQNFTYISVLAPKLAFIVDIRRQNMLLHLMYKALFELSENRAEFLSKLFARAVPPNSALPTRNTFLPWWARRPLDSDLARATLDSVLEHLRERHRFALSAEDSNTIEHVYNAFVSAGPEIRYSFRTNMRGDAFPVIPS